MREVEFAVQLCPCAACWSPPVILIGKGKSTKIQQEGDAHMFTVKLQQLLNHTAAI